MPLKCLIVDDQPVIGQYVTHQIQKRYGSMVDVVYFQNPVEAVPHLNPAIDILIMDYELPTLNGPAFLQLAIRKGISRSNIIILSSHDPDEIRKLIPLGEVLAVINKADREQQEILKMIMDAIVKRARTKRPWL